MRIKNFLFLLLGLAVVAACVWGYTQNRADLDRTVTLFGWETTVLLLVVFAFLAGVAVIFPFWVYRDFQIAAERWREKRKLRWRTQIEEAYRQGTDAAANHRRSEAEGAFRTILQKDGGHRDALIALGNVLRDQGRYEDAAECHRKVIRADERDLEAHYALAEDLEAGGELAAAEGVFRRIIELGPKRSVAAHELLRDLCAKRGQWEKALDVQERLERLPMANKDRRERIRRARLGLEYEVLKKKVEDGESKAALPRLKKLVRAEPTFTPAYVSLGAAEHALGHDREAVSWFQQGYARTGSPVFLKRLEEHFLARHDPGSAISTFKDLVGSRTSDVLPRFFLGRLYNRLEMNNEAWDIFSQLQAENPDSPTVAYYVARVHERRGEYDAACDLYRKVIQDTEGLRIWYQCEGCGEEVAGWKAYCDTCKAWDTYRVEWVESTSPRDLGVGELRPVWTAPEAVPESA